MTTGNWKYRPSIHLRNYPNIKEKDAAMWLWFLTLDDEQREHVDVLCADTAMLIPHCGGKGALELYFKAGCWKGANDG